jgi:hypothetical protein
MALNLRPTRLAIRTARLQAKLDGRTTGLSSISNVQTNSTHSTSYHFNEARRLYNFLRASAMPVISIPLALRRHHPEHRACGRRYSLARPARDTADPCTLTWLGIEVPREPFASGCRSFRL